MQKLVFFYRSWSLLNIFRLSKNTLFHFAVAKRDLVTPVDGSDFEGDAGDAIPAEKEEEAAVSTGKKSPIG